MQNIVYERKQNGEGFFSLPAVTYSRFGNCPANGLVTEQPQYSVAVCIFYTWQNAETKLISNGLRFIFTCSLSLAEPITFHIGRHTFATLSLSNHVPIESISKMLGHSDIRTTQIYAKMQDKTIYEDMATMRNKFDCAMMN
ncbi:MULTISPECIES: tyrosine-type recombinase/integrase [Duncaniella]|uniref:Recombinase n=1 Tax=Duncaniella dubosii TaxID=2518971 RepID=A0A4P7W5U6_9BACT|nr:MULTISPECIES: tyrosine-type recombinase/integrase [Duncaniella]QCD43426.1 recombinase [Duncaniella dubosii]